MAHLALLYYLLSFTAGCVSIGIALLFIFSAPFFFTKLMGREIIPLSRNLYLLP